MIERLILKGIKGIAQDEVFYINYGQVVTIGRQPSCEISYRNFKHYPKDDTKEYMLNISREHVRIAFYNSHAVQIKDLSSNGTFINGKPIRKIFITDIADKIFELRLGPTETFILSADTGTVAR
ncbi:MAG: FHA domain-containing protein [Planctomycetota bacterium]